MDFTEKRQKYVKVLKDKIIDILSTKSIGFRTFEEVSVSCVTESEAKPKKSRAQNSSLFLFETERGEMRGHDCIILINNCVLKNRSGSKMN